MKCKICGEDNPHIAEDCGHDFEPDVAPPGSGAAIQLGCKCAVIDNHHGRGRYGRGPAYGWFVSGDCPVHGFEP